MQGCTYSKQCRNLVELGVLHREGRGYFYLWFLCFFPCPDSRRAGGKSSRRKQKDTVWWTKQKEREALANKRAEEMSSKFKTPCKYFVGGFCKHVSGLNYNYTTSICMHRPSVFLQCVGVCTGVYVCRWLCVLSCFKSATLSWHKKTRAESLPLMYIHISRRGFVWKYRVSCQ